MENEKKKLRIGVIVSHLIIPNWSYKMIEEIKNGMNSEIILTLRMKEKGTFQKSWVANFLKNSREILFNFYVLLDRKAHNCTPNAFEARNLEELSSNSFISIDLNEGKIGKESIDLIYDYELDVIIQIGHGSLHPDLAKVSRYGIWSVEHSESKIHRKDLAGIGEVFHGLTETEIVLSASIVGRKKRLKLYKTRFTTDYFSLYRNKNTFYWKASSVIPLKLKELYELGEEQFFKKVKAINEHPVFNYKKKWSIPSNWEMLEFAPKIILSKLKNKLDLAFNYHQWILLFRISETNKISTDLSKFHKIIPPKDRFWADPHLIKRGDKYYIFFEELIYRDNKGYICLIEMDEQGNYSEPIKILEQNYHLSYPFLIEENNELFMVPESKQNNTIELYRCIQFPLKWELEKVLMKNIKAVDTSILFQKNKYWMFCNITNSEGPLAQDELHLFYSDKLISDNWIGHPKNPVVSDFKRSRPAGKLFMFKNKLYRPAQNGLKRYGYGMAIHQVVELTENEYHEELVDSILPEWDKDILGTHTLNSVDHLTVIDALIKQKKKFSFTDLLKKTSIIMLELTCMYIEKQCLLF